LLLFCFGHQAAHFVWFHFFTSLGILALKVTPVTI
jgi:hypothetical protein